MSSIFVDIDRIVLTGPGMTPDRAERIRAMVQVELQHLLTREGLLDSLTGRNIPSLDAPTTHISEPHSDSRLASGLARSIAQLLQGVR